MQLSNIVHGRIEYKRQKTGKLHSILIIQPLWELMEPFLAGKSGNGLILDVIKSADLVKQYDNVRDELGRYNKAIKKIAGKCGIEANLTSYVSRHSYATISKYKGVPTAIISEALGHNTEETTQIYLDDFENHVLDEYHKKVVG